MRIIRIETHNIDPNFRMIRFDLINWDTEPGGNVEHVAEHGLTPDEVESVLNYRGSEIGVSRSTGNRITFGWTNSGKFIIVVFEFDIDGGFRILTPITAYEVDESTKA